MQIEMVTKEELLTMLSNPDVIVLNVLPRDWYERAHIKGSLSIPLEELPNRLNCLSNHYVLCKLRMYILYRGSGIVG